MAKKRKHTESEPQESVHESRQLQVYGDKPRAVKKPRNSDQSQRKHQSAHAVNDIKKQIRNVRRRLEGLSNLPADVRAEDERALAAHEQALAAAEAEKAKQNAIKKYHMVRFFERQKATRHVKRIRKQILEAKSTEEVEVLKKKLHIAEVDLNYTQFSPLSETYIGIYSQKKSDSDDGGQATDEAKTKPPMWAEVERCMENNTLVQLRNRVPTKIAPISKPLEIRAPKPKASVAPDMSGLNRRERRRQMRGEDLRSKNKSKSAGFEKNQEFGASQARPAYGNNDDGDDDSDGGFFEA